MKKNIFKDSYKIKIGKRDDIYKAFGFKHLSDATNYYVHPDNQSFSGTTTLSQPIGEGLMLFLETLSSICKDPQGSCGDVTFDPKEDGLWAKAEIPVPDEWRSDGIVPEEVGSYKVKAYDDRLCIGAYGKDGGLLPDSPDNFDMDRYYKYLPCVAGAAAFLMKGDDLYRSQIKEYVRNPAPDVFVRLHEDLYQANKGVKYSIVYVDSEGDDEGAVSFREQCRIEKENEKIAPERIDAETRPFEAGDFPREYLDRIPSPAPEFRLRDSLRPLCRAIREGDSISVLFNGPAGTGKTTDCKLICREIGMPVMSIISCTENVDEFVLGKYVPKGDRIEFMESDITKAVRHGGAVVFEEINFAKPQHLSFLNSLLDDNGFILLDNGERVARHPNFRFFATMNTGYFGTRELNQSLYNRFMTIVETDDLTDEEIRRMLLARVPGCSAVADKIISVYHKIKNRIKSEELDYVISPRNLENWARMAKYEHYITAAEKTLIPIAKGDPLFAESIRGILRLHRWS